jgi:hypothetical protein
VQALAACVKELPSRYVLPEQDRHGALLVGNEMPEPIPVIDLSRLPVDADESDKLQAALQGWGVFQVSFFVHLRSVLLHGYTCSFH